MKYLKVALRSIIALIFYGANFAVNGMVCAYVEPRLASVMTNDVLLALSCIGIFIYMIFQIGLLVYLMAKSMARSCKKYGIKYC